MIHVFDNWYIEPDELNWQSFQMKEQKSRKTGEITLRKSNVLYHHDLHQALKSVLADCKRSSFRKYSGGISDAIADMKRFEADLEGKIISAIQIAVKENKDSKML